MRFGEDKVVSLSTSVSTDGEVGSVADLPDEDGDGIPDVLEVEAAAPPAPASAVGKNHTGLAGSGAMGPTGLLLSGVPGLLWSRIRKR